MAPGTPDKEFVPRGTAPLCEHLYCRGRYRCAPFYTRWVFNVLYALRIIE